MTHVSPFLGSSISRLPVPNAICLPEIVRTPAPASAPDLALVRDPRRLDALAQYGGSDAPAPLGLDDVAHLAARLCGTGAAIVSVFDAERQLFKARIGTELSELPVTQTACTYTLGEPGVLVIPDLSRDARTQALPFVAGAPHMRFYAGTPLVAADGHALGTICVLDRAMRPGGLTPQQRDDLMALARQVMMQLDQRRTEAELRRVIAERDALIVEASAEAERQSILVLLGDALRGLADPAEIGRVASGILCDRLGLGRVGYLLASPDGRHLERVADSGREAGPSFLDRYALAEFPEIAEAIKRGEVVVVEDARTDPRLAGRAEFYRTYGLGTLVIVPTLVAGRLEAAFCLQSTGVREWSPAMLRFVQAVTDRTGAEINRARIEAKQALLNREIGHRMKNMLAMVQAIATQTLRGNPDPAAASVILADRFQALASAHDLLLRGHLAESDLRALTATVLSVHIGTDAAQTRLRVEGPSLHVPAQVAMSLALILHELGTNATKYGAWSNEAGYVDLTWDLTPEGLLDLCWQERDGPAVTPPLRRGFGSRLIERGLFGTGTVTVDFAATGLCCAMTASLVSHAA